MVIDSIAYPFRQEGGAGQRSRLLSSLSQDLYRNALQKRVAVVVVNHVTTKVFRGGEGGGEAGESQVTRGRGRDREERGGGMLVNQRLMTCVLIGFFTLCVYVYYI